MVSCCFGSPWLKAGSMKVEQARRGYRSCAVSQVRGRELPSDSYQQ
jgi:hypothetical protein